MPEMVASPTANHIAVHALSAMGKGDTEIAHTLGMDRATAWRMRHKELLDPALIHHASKTISNKLVLAGAGAVDTLLDRIEGDQLKDEKAIDLAKIASICLQSAGAFAALSGGKDTLTELAAEYGISGSHSASRVTMEQRITVESSTHGVQATVINASADPQLGAEPAT